jgi:hypothetical protein
MVVGLCEAHEYAASTVTLRSPFFHVVSSRCQRTQNLVKTFVASGRQACMSLMILEGPESSEVAGERGRLRNRNPRA